MRRLGTIWRIGGEGEISSRRCVDRCRVVFTLILSVISVSTPRMSVLWRPFATSFKPSTLTYRHRVVPIGCRRCIASVAPNAGEGPLAGLCVLDMTRVLAGVRWTYLAAYSARLIKSCLAILHADPWRPRVCQMIPVPDLVWRAHALTYHSSDHNVALAVLIL